VFSQSERACLSTKKNFKGPFSAVAFGLGTFDIYFHCLPLLTAQFLSSRLRLRVRLYSNPLTPRPSDFDSIQIFPRLIVSQAREEKARDSRAIRIIREFPLRSRPLVPSRFSRPLPISALGTFVGGPAVASMHAQCRALSPRYGRRVHR